MAIIVNREFIKKYLYLVKSIVNKTAINFPVHVDREDLEQQGLLGLLNAAKRYDPEKKVKFGSYASHVIRGHILDYAKYHWPVSVPRSVREKKSTIRKSVELKSQMIQDKKIESAAHCLTAEENKKRLLMAVKRLQFREKLVIVLYYYEGLVMRDIGELMGLTVPRVSQLHSMAMQKMYYSEFLKYNKDT